MACAIGGLKSIRIGNTLNIQLIGIGYGIANTDFNIRLTVSQTNADAVRRGGKLDGIVYQVAQHQMNLVFIGIDVGQFVGMKINRNAFDPGKRRVNQHKIFRHLFNIERSWLCLYTFHLAFCPIQKII
ncbi:hypothetical protein D3C87_1361090 [compost metagenome]